MPVGTTQRQRTDPKKVVEDLGGKLEGFYFNASGQVHVKTTPLISAEEVDAASHEAVQ